MFTYKSHIPVATATALPPELPPLTSLGVEEGEEREGEFGCSTAP